MPISGWMRSATAIVPASRPGPMTSCWRLAKSFISALGHNVLFPLRNGVAGSIMDGRASPERILQTIERDRVTLLYSVATLYRRILAVPRIEQGYDLRSLRGANSTGEPLEDSVRNEWESRIDCPIWEHYGISEAQMVIGDGPGMWKRQGSVGRTWGAQAAVLDDELRPMPIGSTGTLAFSSDYPGFFLGYPSGRAQPVAAAGSSPAISRAWTATATFTSWVARTTASRARAY